MFRGFRVHGTVCLPRSLESEINELVGWLERDYARKDHFMLSMCLLDRLSRNPGFPAFTPAEIAQRVADRVGFTVGFDFGYFVFTKIEEPASEQGIDWWGLIHGRPEGRGYA